MDEITKYTKLWDLPQGYGNNWEHPYWQEIGEFVLDNMIRKGLWHRQSVLDIGGGNGGFWRSMSERTNLDVTVTTLDIAPNSGADIIADISEYDQGPENAGSYAWVVAIDMLEHLPTDRVYDALRNIHNLALNGAIFLISTRPDRGGKKIGATLHMTVRPPEWWCKNLKQHWNNVELLRTVPGEYCIVVCT